MKDLARSPAGTTATAAFSGPVITPPGGYPLPVHSPEFALVVRSPVEAENDAVAMLADQGATMVKLAFEPGVMPDPWPTLPPAIAAAACNAARRLGLVIRCHVQDLSGLEPALDAGVHAVEHVPHRWIDNGAPRPVLNKDGSVIEKYRKLLERMAREDIILTPTLDVLSRSPWNGPPLFEPVRFFHRMGGRIAAGNDFPYRRTGAGMILPEIQLLAESGLDKGETLRAATSGSAAACGFTDRGIIAPGMRGRPAGGGGRSPPQSCGAGRAAPHRQGRRLRPIGESEPTGRLGLEGSLPGQGAVKLAQGLVPSGRQTNLERQVVGRVVSQKQATRQVQAGQHLPNFHKHAARPRQVELPALPPSRAGGCRAPASG